MTARRFRAVSAVAVVAALASALLAMQANPGARAFFRVANFVWAAVALVVAFFELTRTSATPRRGPAVALLVATLLCGSAAFMVPLRLRFASARADATVSAEALLRKVRDEPRTYAADVGPIDLLGSPSEHVDAITCRARDDQATGLEIVSVDPVEFIYCPHGADELVICCDLGDALSSLGGGWYLVREELI